MTHVIFSYTFSDPRTMMVIARDANITLKAMDGPHGSNNLAWAAISGISSQFLWWLFVSWCNSWVWEPYTCIAIDVVENSEDKSDSDFCLPSLGSRDHIVSHRGAKDASDDESAEKDNNYIEQAIQWGPRMYLGYPSDPMDRGMVLPKCLSTMVVYSICSVVYAL